MNFVKVPNLPEKPVKAAVVDGRASDKVLEALAGAGVRAVKTVRHPGVYAAIAYHPDIMLHHIKDNVIVYAPGTGESLIRALEELGFSMLVGESCPGSAYPGDIAYNAARVGRFAFHNLDYTDPVLRRELEADGVELVHVKQGYAKCSVAVIDANSIITSDPGIARAAEHKGIDVLFLPGEEGIRLPGLDYGFIGGCCGLVAKDLLFVAGDLSHLNSYSEIVKFLESKQMRLLQAPGEQVTDYGSVLPLLTE